VVSRLGAGVADSGGSGKSRRTPVLMLVHAHPDDESSQTGGTLARYAAAGYRTVLVTCTDGRHGDAIGLDAGLVPARRSGELDDAAKALGVSDVVKLGYPDSGMHEGGVELAAADSFSRLPITPIVHQLVRLIRLFGPDVLVTYPPNGLSGHPDHIRTHEAVVAAHRNIVANSDSIAPKLYYIALSATSVRRFQATARAIFGDEAWMPPDEMAVDDAQITTRLDVTSFWPDKLRALAAHASQPDAQALLQMFSNTAELDDTGLRTEEYVRAYPPPVAGFVVEDDLF
jgi:LmbE family N-acetylglucosaminyl deacetylase